MMKQMKEKHTCPSEAKQDVEAPHDEEAKSSLVDHEKDQIEDLESSQPQAFEESIEAEIFEDKPMNVFELHDHDEHCSRNRVCKPCNKIFDS